MYYNTDYTFQNFSQKIKSQGHDARDNDFLKKILDVCLNNKRIQKVEKGKGVWRAQAAYCKKIIETPGGDEDVPSPCAVRRLIPTDLIETREGDQVEISEGRANPKGKAVFYCAKDKTTSLLECNPYRGILLTVAQFKIKRDLKVINFAVDKTPLDYLYLSEPRVKEEDQDNYFLSWIDDAFRMPLSSMDDKKGYLPTQILSGFIKNTGFDGIAYNSAALDGDLNLALFDINSVECIALSRQLYKTEVIRNGETIEYKFSEY